MLWAFMHSIMLFMITVKLMFFMRVSENFSSMVKLMSNIMTQVIHFTLFVGMWMITLILMFRLSSISLVEGSLDYAEINSIFALFIQIFRNSLGDIRTPRYGFWFPTH